jgi:hypothetical protein
MTSGPLRLLLTLAHNLVVTSAKRLRPMLHHFPPLRSQATMIGKTRADSRVLPAPVDLTLLAALAFVVALALF